MLPLAHQITFFVFALIAGAFGIYGFYRVYKRVSSGAPTPEARWNRVLERVSSALLTTLTQERVFRKRSVVSTLHSFIMYGFTFYLLVNGVDGLEGYFKFNILSSNFVGAAYNFLADLLSLGVLIGVIALVYRRFYGKSKRDFKFNERTVLHEKVKNQYISRDSLIVSAFIVFHVGMRVVGQGFKLVEEGRDSFQPFSSAVASLFIALGASPSSALEWRIWAYWGALGSILLFLSYFPRTKHIHLFAAPLNYALSREENSGTLPFLKLEHENNDEPKLGAKMLEDLAWPRLLDAYSCTQCNRCQDVCPASATGKALSPAALEINKRMELNSLEFDGTQPRPLLEFALSEEALWACTTCGACMQVCPVQDEQMLDLIDLRRHQVMVEGEFPAQLTAAFRGMERNSNPWGISREKRLEWADGLKVPTVQENPNPDVLYWVGCAAAYDPNAQKAARAFVQLLERAGVNYAVLGKAEGCTGDTARRAGNEALYQELAGQNIATLNTVNPKLIVATCPHCMNALGNEYPQLGGNYEVMHHTQYLEMLHEENRLVPRYTLEGGLTYHDPCYLGRHNGVYDSPRATLNALGAEILELERSRENSFCCGAGGAQFWKEEEPGEMRVSSNRFDEIQARLNAANPEKGEPKTLAVGCPFCKSMLGSSPGRDETVQVKDVAELLLESVR
ncbi:MAG: (Fe-S)-binding protein [Pseudopedobacter sp.]|nr:(Fe-S)-binding protein [Deinococcales bacterium]